MQSIESAMHGFDQGVSYFPGKFCTITPGVGPPNARFAATICLFNLLALIMIKIK